MTECLDTKICYSDRLTEAPVTLVKLLNQSLSPDILTSMSQAADCGADLRKNDEEIIL